MTQYGFFKVRPTRNGSMWVAWGALKPLRASYPLDEKIDPVHACFANTENAAVEQLFSEMESAYGPLCRWRLETA